MCQSMDTSTPVASEIATMAKRDVKCLIFDMGGTLYRPALDLCGLTREFLSKLEQTSGRIYDDTTILEALEEPNKWLEGYMMSNDVGPYWYPEPEQWLQYDRILLRELGISEDLEGASQIYQSAWDDFLGNLQTQLIEGVVETFDRLLESNIKLGLASNRFDDPRPILADDGLLERVGAVEYSRVPGYCKPSPYMLFRVSDALRENPARCAYVGNIVKYDVVAAQRAGMLPVLLTWCDPEEEEKAPGETVVMNHIDGLLDLVETG